MSKFKYFVFKFLSLINRFAHFIDVIILFVFVDWLISVQFAGETFAILFYVLPILQLILAVKYEIKVFKSRKTCEYLLRNSRVTIVEGAQGQGKSSFTYFLNSFKKVVSGKVYTNSPVKLNNNFVYVLDKKILNLDERIEDYSSLIIDEATLYFNNLKSLSKRDKGFADNYSQEVLTQLVRHFYDGWIFYVSVEGGRLPAVIEENCSSKIQMLGQGSKVISYITTPILCFVAKLFNIKLPKSLRFWDCQQYMKIAQDNYLFDLSTQVKDSNTNKFANLMQIYCFDNPYLFEYVDRFMAGVYKELPEHRSVQWASFDFNTELLQRMGYGCIIDYFSAKKYNVLPKEEITNAINSFKAKQEINDDVPLL